MKNEFLNKEPLLEIKGLKVKFPDRKRILTAVDGVDLQIRPGEIVGVVGESGSGKSVMSHSILRLREYDSAVRYEGEILFEIAKPANRATENNGVDAISGATITSQALGKTLNQWFGFYQNYFAKNGTECLQECCNECKTECCEECTEVEPANTVEE